MSATSAGAVSYEFPLNERVRTLLRLEALFLQGHHHVGDASPWGGRAAFATLHDILNIFARTDLKSEIIKELERQSASLGRMRGKPEADQALLQRLLADLSRLTTALYEDASQVGIQLRKNEFINAVRQRIGMPGGTCSFDVPAYQHWLTRPATVRERDLREWFAAFATIERAINLILELTRGSAAATPETATGGFFQLPLDPAVPCQMLRVELPAEAPCFAEISGGRHRFSVRFLIAGPDGRPQQTAEDIRFRLTRCVL